MPTLQFSERALIAREQSTGRRKAALDKALGELEARGRISGDKPLRIKDTEDVWAARVDADLRLLFSSRGDEVVILDIISRSEYLRYMP
jgi:hypothetical protein